MEMLDELMQPGRLNVFSLGVYFGNTFTEEQKKEANERGIRMLQKYGVIPVRANGELRQCPRCKEVMRSVGSSNRGIGWRYICKNGHRLEATMNTCLERVRMRTEFGVDKMIKFVFLWLRDWPANKIQRDVRVSNESAISWTSYFRDIATMIAWHEFLELGGSGDIVKVDETRILKRNCRNISRRKLWQDCWLIVATSRTSKKKFGVIVRNPTSETLFPILQRHIDNDTFILTSKWNIYKGIGTWFRGHGRIKSIMFPPRNEDPLWVPNGTFNEECLDQKWVGPAPGPQLQPIRFHTQDMMEKSWAKLKRILGQCRNVSAAYSYIGEWMYRENKLKFIPDETVKFETFLRDIARAYPGVGRPSMSPDVENCYCIECQ